MLASMNLQFLCAKHRQWVHSNGDKALPYLRESQKQGELFYHQHRYRESLSYLGTAFESIEILLEQYNAERFYLVSHLTVTALKINECLVQLDAEELSHEITQRSLRIIHRIFQQRSTSTEQQQYLNECAQHLNHDPAIRLAHHIHQQPECSPVYH